MFPPPDPPRDNGASLPLVDMFAFSPSIEIRDSFLGTRQIDKVLFISASTSASCTKPTDQSTQAYVIVAVAVPRSRLDNDGENTMRSGGSIVLSA